MNNLHLGALLLVSDKLRKLELRHVFIGGAVAPLLVDDVELSGIRPTEDVDVIVDFLTEGDYARPKRGLEMWGFSMTGRKELQCAAGELGSHRGHHAGTRRANGT